MAAVEDDDDPVATVSLAAFNINLSNPTTTLEEHAGIFIASTFAALEKADPGTGRTLQQQ